MFVTVGFRRLIIRALVLVLKMMKMRINMIKNIKNRKKRYTKTTIIFNEST